MTGKDRQEVLTSLLESSGSQKSLIFVDRKSDAEKVARSLQTKGIACVSIHGDKSQYQRELALRSFRSGSERVLVATSIVARGLDVPNIGQVVNYALPPTIEEYVHRVGRTGRAGHLGNAMSLVSSDDTILKDLTRLLRDTNQEVPTWLAGMLSRPSQSSGHFQRKRYGNSNGRSRYGSHDNRSYKQSSFSNRR